jgi:ATP-binding cassette subfamily B protein
MSSGAALLDLWRLMPARRRRHLGLLVGMMLVGAFSELLTIGSVLPFLQLMIEPERLERFAAARSIMQLLEVERAADLVIPAALLVIGAAIFAAVTRIVLLWASQEFVFRLARDFDTEIFERSIRQPYEIYVQRNTSEIQAGLEKVNTAVAGMLLPLMQACISAVIALFIFLLLFLIEPMTALVSAAFMGLLYFSINLYTARLRSRISERWSDVVTARTKLVQESLGGFRDITLDHSQPFFERHFRELDSEFRSLSAKRTFISLAPRFLVEGAGVVLIGLLTLHYSTQPGGVVQAIPVLGALALGAQRLLPLVQAVYLGWTNFSTMRHPLAEIIRLMNWPDPAVLPALAADPPVPFAGTIELRGVTFRYGNRFPAVHDVDLLICKGDRVGLVGKTGSGKSTLVDIIMGLLRPTRGEMLVGGNPLAADTIQNWQAQIAHVPQSIYLADDTIAANIAFGLPSAEHDFERIQKAAAGASIDDFISGLPEGYATRVGERGIRLAGGQRQRIGIARALYKRASILILDEGTSALDDGTEASVMEAIAALDPGLTLIIIAHRTSTLANCTKVVRLDRGRVVQQGSYEEVIGSSAARPLGQVAERPRGVNAP